MKLKKYTLFFLLLGYKQDILSMIPAYNYLESVYQKHASPEVKANVSSAYGVLSSVGKKIIESAGRNDDDDDNDSQSTVSVDFQSENKASETSLDMKAQLTEAIQAPLDFNFTEENITQLKGLAEKLTISADTFTNKIIETFDSHLFSTSVKNFETAISTEHKKSFSAMPTHGELTERADKLIHQNYKTLEMKTNILRFVGRKDVTIDLDTLSITNLPTIEDIIARANEIEADFNKSSAANSIRENIQFAYKYITFQYNAGADTQTQLYKTFTLILEAIDFAIRDARRQEALSDFNLLQSAMHTLTNNEIAQKALQAIGSSDNPVISTLISMKTRVRSAMIKLRSFSQYLSECAHTLQTVTMYVAAAEALNIMQGNPLTSVKLYNQYTGNTNNQVALPQNTNTALTNVGESLQQQIMPSIQNKRWLQLGFDVLKYTAPLGLMYLLKKK